MKGLRWGHDPVLQLKRSKTFVDVEKDLTLIQTGITDGAICQIRGEPRPALFSRAGQRVPDHLVIEDEEGHTK